MTPIQLRKLRIALGYTQQQMATFLLSGCRCYQKWEGNESMIHPRLADYIRLKVQESFPEINFIAAIDKK